MPKRPSRLPRDPNARAFAIVQLATGQSELPPETTKNPAAVALGRLGGAKGGHARAAALSARRKRQIAKKAAAARWGKKR